MQRIDVDPDIEALAPAPFSTVCFRFRPSTLKALSGDARRRQACDEYLDRLNEAVLRALLADLVARRRQIVEMIAAEAQRTRRMSDKRLTKSVARLRKALEKELSELDVLIDEVSAILCAGPV